MSKTILILSYHITLQVSLLQIVHGLGITVYECTPFFRTRYSPFPTSSTVYLTALFGLGWVLLWSFIALLGFTFLVNFIVASLVACSRSCNLKWWINVSNLSFGLQLFTLSECFSPPKALSMWSWCTIEPRRWHRAHWSGHAFLPKVDEWLLEVLRNKRNRLIHALCLSYWFLLTTITYKSSLTQKYCTKKPMLFLVCMGKTGLFHDIFFEFSLRPFEVVEVEWKSASKFWGCDLEIWQSFLKLWLLTSKW